jgi:hypothetical protein
VIASLRRGLLSAIGRGPAKAALRSGRTAQGDTEASQRIEAARRRLKAAIPPPPD